jgi:hypothetical protein
MEITTARSLAFGVLLLAACTQINAAEPAKKTAPAQDEPEVVFGQGPSRAMTTVTTSAPASKAIAVGSPQTWTVETRDINLANTFQRWAGVAGWRVRWDAAMHVMVEAPDSVSGSFEDAITAQLSSPGIANSAYPLEVCFYPNTPPLARITRKGDQAKDCQ